MARVRVTFRASVTVTVRTRVYTQVEHVQISPKGHFVVLKEFVYKTVFHN